MCFCCKLQLLWIKQKISRGSHYNSCCQDCDLSTPIYWDYVFIDLTINRYFLCFNEKTLHANNCIFYRTQKLRVFGYHGINQIIIHLWYFLLFRANQTFILPRFYLEWMLIMGKDYYLPLKHVWSIHLILHLSFICVILNNLKWMRPIIKIN